MNLGDDENANDASRVQAVNAARRDALCAFLAETLATRFDFRAFLAYLRCDCSFAFGSSLGW
jgi:hypothetical protein